MYEGEFKNGSLEGEGKMLVHVEDKADSIVIGFWKGGDYIGKYKSLYKEHSKSVDILSLRVTEAKDVPEKDKNTLFFTIYENGSIVYNPTISISQISGNYSTIFPANRTTKVKVISFPFWFTISYQGQSVEMEIYRASSYNIAIDFNLN